jgi:hypothetical protein
LKFDFLFCPDPEQRCGTQRRGDRNEDSEVERAVVVTKLHVVIACGNRCNAELTIRWEHIADVARPTTRKILIHDE